MAHAPLSATLSLIIAELPPHRTVTLNEVIDKTGSRGPYTLLVILSLPFVTPISLPGISNVLGIVMVVLAWKLLRERPAHLPRFAGQRPLSTDKLRRAINAGVRVLRVIEKVVKPRGSPWMSWRTARTINTALIGTMALMLALPIPPTIPLSNTLPAYAIILLSFSIMEEDGVLIWFGYALASGTLVYLMAMFVLQAAAISALYSKYFHRMIEWFQP